MSAFQQICESATRFATAADPAPSSAAARREVEKVLTDDPIALGYRPQPPSAGFWEGSSNLPSLQQMILDVEAMQAHPRVLACMDYYRSGIESAEFEFEASSPDVEKFAAAQLGRFWQRTRHQVQRGGYEYGRGGYELSYTMEDGLLAYDGSHDFHPLDCGVLTRDHKYLGVRVRNVQPGGDVDLWGPHKVPAKGFWYAHNRRFNRFYGRPQGYGAWRPWRRLAGRDGLEETVDGGVYRFAFKPPIGRYPAQDDQPRPAGGATGLAYGKTNQPLNNRDRMRQMLEVIKAGGVIAFSSRRDQHGNYVWDADFPEHALNVSSLVEYLGTLEDAISLGVGVPPELIEASEVGSGYSGRAIPMEAFYAGQQHNADETVWAWKEQIGDPLVRWNFGPQAWFKVRVKPLLETKMKARQGAEQKPQPRQDDQQQPPDARQQSGSAPPEQVQRPPNPNPGGQRFATHAPKGGATIGGKKYAGGEFIPADELAKATSEEKAKIESGRWAHVTAAMQAAHPFPAAPPPPVNLDATQAAQKMRGQQLSLRPEQQAAQDAWDRHQTAHVRAYIAYLVGRTLNEEPPPIRPPMTGDPRQAKLVKKAIELARELAGDVGDLGPDLAAHHAAVAASHLEGPAAIEAAQAEAKRRYQAALAVAERHIEALPPDTQAKWRNVLSGEGGE